MLKTHQTTLTCLMAWLPLLCTTQTCQPQAILATAPTTRYVQYSNGTVLDKYTGLMWKACSEGQAWNTTSRTCNLDASKYDWQQALQQAQKVNTKGGFAKYKDWRVPNIKELRTLVEEQCIDPTINLSDSAAIFAKDCFGIHAGQSAKITRQPMPAAAPAVLAPLVLDPKKRV